MVPSNVVNPFGPDITANTPAGGASQPAVSSPTEQIALAVELHEGGGALTAIPAGSTNGTPLGVIPQNANGVKIYCKPSDSVSYTIAQSQPASAPGVVVTFATASGGQLSTLEERLANGENLYITAIVGTPAFRWY